MNPLFERKSHRADIEPVVEARREPEPHWTETAYQRAEAGEQVVFPMPQEDQLPQSDAPDVVAGEVLPD